jgi:hypothetical protein
MVWTLNTSVEVLSAEAEYTKSGLKTLRISLRMPAWAVLGRNGAIITKIDNKEIVRPTAREERYVFRERRVKPVWESRFILEISQF